MGRTDRKQPWTDGKWAGLTGRTLLRHTHLRPVVGGGLGLLCSMAAVVVVVMGGGSMAGGGGGSMAGGGSGGVGGGGRGVATGRFWTKSVLDVCFWRRRKFVWKAADSRTQGGEEGD